MKTYIVTFPIAGSASAEVEASSEDEAIKKALDLQWSCKFESKDDVELVELESYDKLVEGNCVYASCWEAEAELVGDDE